MSLFDKFTNQYELSKTLRFELRAVGETQEIFESFCKSKTENNPIQLDKVIDKAKKEIQKDLDVLHREFVKQALSQAKLYYEDFFKAFKKYQETPKKEYLSLLEIKETLNNEVENNIGETQIFKEKYDEVIDKNKTPFECFLKIWKYEYDLLYNEGGRDKNAQGCEAVDKILENKIKEFGSKYQIRCSFYIINKQKISKF